MVYARGVAPKSRIDRYVAEERLSSAGPVDSFRVHARDRVRTDGGQYVLKVLFADRLAKPAAGDITRGFLAAARRCLACSTPTIAPVTEVSDDPDAPFVARQWVAGTSLGELVRKRKDGLTGGVAPTVAGLLCADIAGTLEAARHGSAPLFHLGLSPANGVLTEAGHVVITDFGIAAALGWPPGGFDRSPFVAPELRGSPVNEASSEALRAADAFSLGALLYFLATGRIPGEGESTSGAGQRAQPLNVPLELPDHLATAIRWLTDVNPNRRPQLNAALRSHLSSGIESEQERQRQLAKALGVTPKPPSASRGAPSDVAAGPAPVVVKKSAATVARRQARPPMAGWRIAAAIVACLVAAAAYYQLRAPRQTDPAKRHVHATSSNDPTGVDAGVQAADKPSAGPASPEMNDTPKRIPGRLFLATTPDQADVWIDGVLRGRTPVDVDLGPGGHRVFVIKAGYLMMKAVFDTTQGDYARRSLQRAGFPLTGDGVLDVACDTPNRYPILIDGEETGLLCPASNLHIRSGKRTVGIFLPTSRKIRAADVQVLPGLTPTVVNLKN